MKLKVKNWADFQHYKGRKPPWIKLHRDLLDNYQFFLLPVESRALAPMLWLIASENIDGSINLDSEALAFRLHMSSEALAQALNPLIERDFFVTEEGASAMLARCLQPACPEAEAEAEREAEREGEAAAEQRQSRGDCLPAAAEPFDDAHKSVFSFYTVEQFVIERKPHSTNPGGLARMIWRSGAEDSAIGQWMLAKEGRNKREERPAAPELVVASDFDMDAWVDDLIANNWIPQLENELEQINERGGPKLPWERKVVAYFNRGAEIDAA